jgi:hypothetical protein
MEFKSFYQDIEVETFLPGEESNMDILLDVLQEQFRSLVTNAKILKYFNIDTINGE